MGLGSLAIALQLCTFHLSLAAAVGPAETRESREFLVRSFPFRRDPLTMGGSCPLSMECPEDFVSILREQGLPPAYRYDAAVHHSQAALPGTLAVQEAFRRGLPALFKPCRIYPNRDGFAALVFSQPESFDLPAGPTGEQVRAVIVRGLAADPDLAFHLLPAGEEPQAADGTRLFPPEQGEAVADHWIWYVHARAFFPGPVWLLVPRNGKEPPYAYGYL